MHFHPHSLLGAAARLPKPTSTPILSFSPITIAAPGRKFPLELRVTIPSTFSSSNKALPIILLSHGHGRSNYLSSLEGYAPLYEFYAAHGFAVLQPTHLTSQVYGVFQEAGPDEQLEYRQDRPLDFVRILDDLDAIEDAVPGLKGKLDSGKIAIVGHSMGAWTASTLLGAINTHQNDKTVKGAESRIKAGVIIGGLGSAPLNDSGHQKFPYYSPDFSNMSTPALVVFGSAENPFYFTERGADWHADPYHLASGSKELLEVKGSWHLYGGISGWDAKEASDGNDQDPERLGVVQRMTLAYLKSQLEGENAWKEAVEAFGKIDLGKVESKQ